MMFTKMQFEFFSQQCCQIAFYFRLLNEVSKTLEYVDAFMNLARQQKQQLCSKWNWGLAL